MSIYGENFETPPSREPYFIKVHRCITNCMAVWMERWPMPSSQEKIEIVVPDINDRKKFYKHVVYNHTSCKCGASQSVRLHKNLTFNEGKHFNESMDINAILDFCRKSTV